MNILPNLNELIPISNNNIFYECGFSNNFESLTFEQKLQVLCDIVRQSIYPNGFPNPDNDITEMNGNCYTSSYCFLDYIKKLKIGNNARCALARKREFDLDEITSIHVVVLVDSDDGHTYQVDSTPFAGYKFGSVDDITYKCIYDEYVIIDETINTYLYKFRKIIYEDSINQFDVNRINEYLELCDIVAEIPILKGYVAIILKIIIKYLNNQYEKDEIRKKINFIKPYNKTRPDKLIELNNMLKIQTNIWLEELRDLQCSNNNFKRQSELAITIVQENKWLNKFYERYINISGKKVSVSSINPRFLYERGYNVALVKLYDQNFKIMLIDKSSSKISKYVTNLSEPTQQLGIKPVLFFHPFGEKNIDFMTNYTANSCCESSLSFLSGYPEHQVMTRFMYPNPRLVKK